MLRLLEARQRLAGTRSSGPLHGHMLARLGEHGRRLRPDIAAADYASGGGEFVYHSIDIGTGVHAMDTDDAVAAGMSSGGQAARQFPEPAMRRTWRHLVRPSPISP